MGFNITNPVEQQLQWLQQERPQYLGSYAESLEHLCFASNGQNAVDTIRATLAVSEQLTTSMRGRIEHGFNAPVHQGYGLGEIGMVAIECDAGRFHVHTEHCIVEIVDAEGNPCKPGDVGRIVVTALNNYAMPLIRYDTDDLAQVVDGPCPCGRTLPAFGKISGRYSRIAFLPEGTLPLVAAIRTVIDTMPDAVAQNFRRYQLHQYRDNRFELRLVTSGELTEEFHTLIRSSWQQACGNSLIELDIKIVPELSRTAGGKNLEFTSDFMPAPD
jgi:phenylacetate-CoA ligase